MARYHGGKGVSYMSASGTTAAVNLGNLSKWSLQSPRSREDVTAMGDGNKRYVQSPIPDFKGNFEVWFDDSAVSSLFTAAASADGVLLYHYPSSLCATKYFYGPAWVDITNFEVDVNGAVKMSGSWAANGNWGTQL